MSKAEQNISRFLRARLKALPIEGAIEDRRIVRNLGGLDFFIPQILREQHAEWKHESLDGVVPLYVRKTGELEVEIVGNCILISDQTVTPIYLRLQLDDVGERVAWLECRLGENENGTMKRVKYTSAWPIGSVLAIRDDPDAIEWSYHVSYGERT